jgi:hypothetical protein
MRRRANAAADRVEDGSTLSNNDPEEKQLLELEQRLQNHLQLSINSTSGNQSDYAFDLSSYWNAFCALCVSLVYHLYSSALDTKETVMALGFGFGLGRLIGQTSELEESIPLSARSRRSPRKPRQDIDLPGQS